MATPLFDLLLVAAGVTEEVGGGEVAAAGVPEEVETDVVVVAEVVDSDVDEDDADVLVKLVLVVEVEVYEVYVAEGSIVVTTVPGDKLKT
jgi:hypothetical protein